MKKIWYVFLILVLLISISCTKKDLSDSIIQKINDEKISELTAEEKAYWDNVGIKSSNGEKLTPGEAKVYERLQELNKQQNPAIFLPDKCLVGGNFNCLNSSVSKSSIQLVILQLSGYDLKSVKVSINSCKKSSINLDMLNRATKTFLLEDCNNVVSQDTGKFQQDILIEYVGSSGSMATSKGILSSKIK